MQFNYAISASKFPASVKHANITPVLRTVLETRKITIGQ